MREPTPVFSAARFRGLEVRADDVVKPAGGRECSLAIPQCRRLRPEAARLVEDCHHLRASSESLLRAA